MKQNPSISLCFWSSSSLKLPNLSIITPKKNIAKKLINFYFTRNDIDQNYDQNQIKNIVKNKSAIVEIL